MSKIIFILTFQPSPRLERMINTFIKFGYEVYLVYSPRSHFATDPSVNGGERVFIPENFFANSDNIFVRIYKIISFFKKVRKTVNQVNPEYICVSGLDGLLLNFLGKWHKKYSILYDAADLPGGRWRIRPILSFLIDFFESVLLGAVDKITAASRYFQNYDKLRYG